jgi:hypothetical protein
MNLYMKFMNIQRYEHMPFYFYPAGQSVVSFEDGILKFIDFMVDAHELERNKSDFNKSFYFRSRYVFQNFHRYSNDTMANLMFDTQLRKIDYDQMNSVIDRQTKVFYAVATLSHLTALSWATYALRYRRLNKLQCVLVGTAMFYGFNAVNSIEYKLLVDQPVISEARRLGLGQWVQPNGSLRARGLNF